MMPAASADVMRKFACTLLKIEIELYKNGSQEKLELTMTKQPSKLWPTNTIFNNLYLKLSTELATDKFRA